MRHTVVPPSTLVACGLPILGVSKQLALFEVLDRPNISALGTEAIEEYPLAVRRPNGIVDSTFAVGEFEHLHWLARCSRRYPERLMSNYIHDQRIVGGERHMGAASDFTVKRNRLSTLKGYLVGLWLTTPRQP